MMKVYISLNMSLKNVKSVISCHIFWGWNVSPKPSSVVKPSSHMPQTCLRRACNKVVVAAGDTYPPAFVNVCRRHAADIAGCPGPCRQLTGEVELSSTLPVCRRCFRPLLDDISGDFFQCECLSAADADILPSTLTCDCFILHPRIPSDSKWRTGAIFVR